MRNVREDSEEDWNQETQQGSAATSHQDQVQAKSAPRARGNEQVRRLVTTPMPVIEELEEGEDDLFVDLLGLFEDVHEGSSLRMVNIREVLKYANISDESDEEVTDKDDLQRWYADLKCDKAAMKFQEGRRIVRWCEVQQDWMVKPFEIPSPGFTDSEEEEDKEIDLQKGAEIQQDWLEKPVEIPSPRRLDYSKGYGKVRATNARYSDLVEVVLDSGADCHVLPMSYYDESLGTPAFPALRMVISDAQGNAIRTTECRANITFEFQKDDGKVVKVRDSAVFGDVTQPLFAVGKLWKTGWGMEPQDSYTASSQDSGEVCEELNGNGLEDIPSTSSE